MKRQSPPTHRCRFLTFPEDKTRKRGKIGRQGRLFSEKIANKPFCLSVNRTLLVRFFSLVYFPTLSSLSHPHQNVKNLPLSGGGRGGSQGEVFYIQAETRQGGQGRKVDKGGKPNKKSTVRKRQTGPKAYLFVKQSSLSTCLLVSLVSPSPECKKPTLVRGLGVGDK